MAGHLKLYCGLALALLAMGATAADLLADPTRPPAYIAQDGTAVDVPAGRLTSVMMPRKGKPAAVIDGQVVPLGGSVGDARLTRVSESSVVLEGPEGIERLYLTPDVEKRVRVMKGAMRQQKDKP